MSTCEQCGASFEPSNDVVEVTSFRVLCPSCSAKRKAQKAAKLREAAPAQAAPRVEATPAAARGVPPPARVPPPLAAAAKPKPAATLEEAPPAKPAAAPKPVAAKSASAPAAKAVAPAAAAAAPAPAARKVAKPKKKKLDVGSLESHDIAKKGEKRTVMFGFVASFVIVVVAGVFLWKVMNKHKAEAADREAAQKLVSDFFEQFKAYDIQTEDGAQKLIEFVDQNQPLWSQADFAPDVVNRKAKAKGVLETLAERKVLTDKLAAVEHAVADPESLAPDALAEQRRTLEEVAQKADFVGPEFAQHVSKLREDVDRWYIGRLKADAQAASESPELNRAALSRIQQSEDEILKLYEAAYRVWEKNRTDPVLTEKKSTLETVYKELIALSDAAVTRYFTPQIIEDTGWTDLLAGDHASEWIGGKDSKGFERRIENGVMHLLSGEEPATISIGDRDQWRDFVLDLQFTFVKGRSSLFVRLPRVYQPNVEELSFSAEDYPPPDSIDMSVSVIGSNLSTEIKSEDSAGPEVNTINWTQVRKGAIGIQVSKDSEIKFTRVRIKVLR